MNNNYTFDPQEFATRWIEARRGSYYGRNFSTNLDERCAKHIVQIVAGFYDWVSAVTHPLQHHVSGNFDWSPELAETPAAKAAGAMAMSGWVKAQDCVNVDLSTLLTQSIAEMFKDENQQAAHFQSASIGSLLLETFLRTVMGISAGYRGLGWGQKSQRAVVEAQKWDSRKLADFPIWTVGPYPSNPYEDDALKQLEASLERRITTAGSETVPVDNSLLKKVADRLPFNAVTVNNMIDNAREGWPQRKAAEAWIVDHAKGDDVLHLDDETLYRLLTTVLSFHSDTDTGGSRPLGRISKSHYTTEESPFISILRRAIAERPNIIHMGGGKLIRDLWAIGQRGDNDLGRPQGTFDSMRQTLRTSGHYKEGFAKGLMDLRLLMLELPNIIANGEGDRTFCGRFKRMEALPQDIRTHLLGMMMKSPSLYGMSAEQNPLILHIAEALLNGKAHVQDSDEGCLITLDDGTAVRLGPNVGGSS